MTVIIHAHGAGPRAQWFVPRMWLGGGAILTMSGLVAVSQYNLLPATAVIDGLLLCGAFALGSRVHKRLLAVWHASLVVAAWGAIVAIGFRYVGVLDFILAFKSIIYLALLCLYAGKRLWSIDRIATATRVLTCAFLFKYSISSAFSADPKFASRPGLFGENNFELLFLAGMFVVSYERMGPRKQLWLGSFAAVILLSGSRSGILQLALLGAYLLWSGRARFRGYLTLVSLVPVGLAVQDVFDRRGGGQSLTETDRFKFFRVFQQEVADWDGLNWVFGRPPVTPLSDSGCRQLEFWTNLFSFTDPNTCYSVILHSFVLRAVIDFGLLGALLIVAGYWRTLSVSGIDKVKALVVLGLVALNSVSVSGFNSTFCALLFVVVLAARWEEGRDLSDVDRYGRGSTVRQ